MMTARMDTRNRSTSVLRVEIAPSQPLLEDPIAAEYAANDEFVPAEADEESEGPVKAKPKNIKKTADVKWTDSMEKKLIQAVYMHKAYEDDAGEIQRHQGRARGQQRI